jgi:hypothetical protein
MDDSLADVRYRWHQVMFRLDEMDEIAAHGVPEEEAAAFEAERNALSHELLLRLEPQLGPPEVERLRLAHERDRAYARQVRQIEEEGES